MPYVIFVTPHLPFSILHIFPKCSQIKPGATPTTSVLAVLACNGNFQPKRCTICHNKCAQRRRCPHLLPIFASLARKKAFGLRGQRCDTFCHH